MKKFIFLLLIIHLTFNIDNCEAQWFKLPDLPVSGGTRWDMFFINQNTGWMTFLSPNSLIKTTNGGLNWIIQSNNEIRFIQFIDSLIGYANGFIGSTGTIWKTTNGGTNWNSLFMTGNGYADIFFANKDTGWTCGGDGNRLGVWRTLDGGYNWTRQLASTNASNLDRIFFLKNKVNGEYWGWTMKGDGLWRTTNSGVNWNLINGSIGICNTVNSSGVDIYFKDTLNGIITRDYRCFSTTTNGGFNWIQHPDKGSFSSKIGVGDSNKVWLTLGTIDTLIKTNNFFQSYGRQFTATYSGIIFALDTSIVYAGWDQTNMQKTTNGGGPIIYSGIDSLNLSIPLYYSLYQNYPNPFNPSTTIKFFVRTKSYISLSIYNNQGKEVIRLYNDDLLTYGSYKAIVDFGRLNLASGVYFYRLTAKGLKGTDLYLETKKMIFIK
jgi:photosystem II stability/assembly factor-like uncharacterized protein